MSKIDFEKKLDKYQDRREKHKIQKLRYIKLVGETVKTIIRNNDKRLSNNDIKEICLKTYKKYDKLSHVRVRNELSQEITQKLVNQQLMSFYSKADLNEETAKDMLKQTIEIAKEKKDGNLLLKIVEKYESAANLTQKHGITARTTETTDFSKIGKDGLPAQKVVKTLEVTTSEAIREATTSDVDIVDSQVGAGNEE